MMHPGDAKIGPNGHSPKRLSTLCAAFAVDVIGAWQHYWRQTFLRLRKRSFHAAKRKHGFTKDTN